MKVIKREYTPLRNCTSFWTWLWFTKDYPYGTMYGADRANWFRYCGSPARVLIRRRCGFSWDVAYHRDEIGFLHAFLTAMLFIAIMVLGMELMLLYLMR